MQFMPPRPRSPRPHPDALPEPPRDMLRGRNAFEVFRIWLVNGQVATCSTGCATFEEPRTWGELLCRAAMHTAQMYARDRGLDQERVLYEILGGITATCEEDLAWDKLRQVQP
jgi:hypothetical protein